MILCCAVSLLAKLSSGISRISNGQVDSVAAETMHLGRLVNKLSPKVRMDLHTALLADDYGTLRDKDKILPSSFTETDPEKAEDFFEKLKDNCRLFFNNLRDILYKRMPFALGLDDLIVLLFENKTKLADIKHILIDKLLKDNSEIKIYGFLNSMKYFVNNKVQSYLENITINEDDDIIKLLSNFAKGLRQELRPFFTELLDKASIANRLDIVKALIVTEFGFSLTNFTETVDGEPKQNSLMIYQISPLDIDKARELASKYKSNDVLSFLEQFNLPDNDSDDD